MRFLYHYRTLSNDGQQVHRNELVSALRQAGHEVVVVGPRVSEAQAGPSLLASLRGRLPRLLHEILEFAYNLVILMRLRRAIKVFRPDLYYERYNLFQPAGIWMARCYGLPAFVEVNAPLSEERARYGGLRLRTLANWSEAYVWQKANAVLPATAVLANKLIGSGVDPRCVTVIRNGVDPYRFSDALDTDSAKDRLNLRNTIVLGFVGFAREWHGLNRVIDALADDLVSVNTHFVLVGDGPERTRLEEYARVRGVRSRLTTTGAVEREAVPQLIAAFDVALNIDFVPYALALKLFEYMAMGKAIVAHAWPNIEEVLVDGHNARLFDPDDQDALGASLAELSQDAVLRKRLGTAARQTILEKRLTWSENAKRIEHLALGLNSKKWSSPGLMDTF